MHVEELVGQRVAAARERAGMTQAQLGEHLGELLGRPWPRQTVSIAEKGGRKLNSVELFAIALVLDVRVGHLFVPPPDLDVLELPSGVKIDAAQLQGPRVQPVGANAVAPAVLLELPKIIKELDRRVGHDRAVSTQLRSFYEQMMNSMGAAPDDVDEQVPE